MEMTYEEARAFIKESSKSGSVLGLASIRRLMEALGNVQDTLPIIHIAGTNGKGSVGAYLDTIFQKAGLHAARYCSPAVFDPLEVWQYDGKNITETEYANVMSQVKSACDNFNLMRTGASGSLLPEAACARRNETEGKSVPRLDHIPTGANYPTVFEIETAAAFVWFSEKKPDVVLLETGMGGATDATNVIAHPIASVITTISRDHMQFLGDTVEEIAAVKAGIIKEGCPVFSAPQEAAVAEVLKREASKKHAKITLLDETSVWPLLQEPGLLRMEYASMGAGTLSLTTRLAGSYQLRNAALSAETALALLPQLLCARARAEVNCCRQQYAPGAASRAQEAASCSIKEAPERLKTVVTEGIADAVWPGRFEVIGRDPLFVIDGAHNEDAAKSLLRTIQNCFTNQPLTYIIGVLSDKEHEKMLRILLPYADAVYTVTPDNARALSAKALADEAEKFHKNVTACGSLEQAVSLAASHAKAAGTAVLAFGSLSYLGELKKIYRS